MDKTKTYKILNKQHEIVKNVVNRLNVDWWPHIVNLDMHWDSDDPRAIEGQASDEEMNEWFLENGYNIKITSEDDDSPSYELVGPVKDLTHYIKYVYAQDDKETAEYHIGEMDPLTVELDFNKPAAGKNYKAIEDLQKSLEISDEDIEKYKNFNDLLDKIE